MEEKGGNDMRTNPSTNATSASHSVRTTDELWEMARQRAAKDGVSLNYVINEILEGYARGMLNLPRVKVTKSFDGK